jgi:hypothetical protein
MTASLPLSYYTGDRKINATTPFEGTYYLTEAYGVTSCAQFPSNGKAVFTSSVVDHGFPSYLSTSPGWYRAIYPYGGPSCGFGVVAGSTSNLSF